MLRRNARGHYRQFTASVKRAYRLVNTYTDQIVLSILKRCQGWIGGVATRRVPVHTGPPPASTGRTRRGRIRSGSTRPVRVRAAAVDAGLRVRSIPYSVTQCIRQLIIRKAFSEFSEICPRFVDPALLAQLLDSLEPLLRRQAGVYFELVRIECRRGRRTLARRGLCGGRYGIR